jgi:hypothetical protein
LLIEVDGRSNVNKDNIQKQILNILSKEENKMKIAEEEVKELNEHRRNIAMANLALENSKLVLELHKSKFENYKLLLFRKYKLEDNCMITPEGEIKEMDEQEKIEE